MDYKINENIINFLARIESSDDVQKLKEWLAADSAHRHELKEWLTVWDSVDVVNAGKLQYEEAYQRFMYRLQNETSKEKDNKGKKGIKQLTGMVGRVAAIIAVSFSLGILCHSFFEKSQFREASFIENIVPLGSKSEINLPDGSTVWLNAGSSLRYSTNFGRTTRDVYLIGEGYFKVAKQTQIPFIVNTSLMKVKALGTEFNVKAYPEDSITETTLVRGKVVIDQVAERLSINKPIILEPGQKFSVAATPEIEADGMGQTEQVVGGTISEEPIKTRPMVKQLSSATVFAEISWKERNWHIESEPLQELAVKLDRRYDVHIRMDDELKNYRFTGTIKDESLEQVLHAMQLTAPILFKVEGKTVSIYIDPKKIR